MELVPDLQRTLITLLTELVDGPPGHRSYVLNAGDRGLLKSLDTVSAADASALASTGSSIAAHVDHLRYGLSLMNRWSQGENPFDDADWAASWRRTAVTEAEWTERRRELRDEATRWKAALSTPRDVHGVELAGIVGSVAHLAYHLGAIRQMRPALRGPRENG